jgi:hypothetical protein
MTEAAKEEQPEAKGVKRSATPLITYPFSFACFVPLFFYATKQIRSFPVDSILPVVAASLIGAGAVFLLLSAIGRNAAKAAVLTLILVCVFYMFVLLEPFLGVLPDIPAVVAAAAFILIALAYIVVRTEKSLVTVTRALNKACLALLVIELSIILIHTYQWDLSLQSRVPLADQQLDAAILPPEVKPDIYYIILDGCSSEKTFKDLFDFDMSPYTNYLRREGFTIVENAHSNYAMTELSLPSFLNMSYLDRFFALTKGAGSDVSINNYLIRNNRLLRILKRCGYKWINIGSGFGPTEYNPYADENLEGSWLSDPIFMIAQRTVFGPMARNYLIDELRNIRIQQFANLDRSVEKPGPKFVFMHILLPHPPYFFDDKGKAITPEGAETDWTLPETKVHKSYLKQSIYTMKRFNQFVAHLKAASKNPFIVIVHGDHGSATTGSLTSGTVTDTYTKERMGIFLAVFFPEPGRPKLSDSLTPVNVSRVMFNSYFGGRYPLLPDRSYLSNYIEPAKVTDVTEKLRAP